MIYYGFWKVFGKPDTSMTLNGVLAGLVAITAGCANVSPGSSIIIGFLAGIQVVGSVEFLDKKLKIDDPVGAISVHGVPGSLEGSLAALEKDHEFLLKGDVFTDDVIETWLEYKRENEVAEVNMRPHPYEFALYYDI